MTATLEKPDTAETTPAAPARAKRGKAAKTEPPPTPGALACSVSQPKLKDALGRVQRAVSAKPLMPILGNVRLTVKDGALHFACTDLALALVTQIPIEASEDIVEGTYTVPVRLLSDFVTTLPMQPLTLRREGEVLHVQCGRAKAQIKGVESEDFPALPSEKIDREADAHLDSVTLAKALKLTTFSAHPDANMGVRTNLHIALGDELRVEAADGFRLAVFVDADGGRESEDRPFDVLVPLRGAQEIARLLTDGVLEAWLLPTPKEANHLVLRTEGTTLSARLSEGQYYDLERVTPRDNPITITAPRVALLAAVNQALLFAPVIEGKDQKDQKGQFQALRLVPDTSGLIPTLTLRATGPERGEGASEVEVTIDVAEGAELSRTAINGPYLRDVLMALEGSEVVLKIRDAVSPMLVTDPALATWRAVIMPIHLPGE